MGTKRATGSSRHQISEDELPHTTVTLIRKLVVQANHTREIHPSHSENKEPNRDLLFTGEVDEVRCLLVKTEHGRSESTILSPREQEIARMIAKGYPNKTIAAVLEISVWTVSTHLRGIFAN